VTPLKTLTKLHWLRLPNGSLIGGWSNTPANRAAVRDYLASQ